jgi:hypothetical protein
MENFGEWLALHETSNTVNFLDGQPENTQDGQDHKFVLTPDGKIIIGPPGMHHNQIAQLSGSSDPFSSCILGSLVGRAVSMKSNGKPAPLSLVYHGLKELFKAGMITPRSLIVYPKGNEEVTIRGADVVSGNLRADTTETPQGPHITTMKAQGQDRSKMLDSQRSMNRKVYQNREQMPNNWFYRYGESSE